MVRGREPTMVLPPHPKPGQLQIRIYDHWAPIGRAPATTMATVTPAAPRLDEVARGPRPLEMDLHRR
jgi:hypothetical protein